MDGSPLEGRRVGGKVRWTFAVYEAHTEALIADLARYYQRDLGDLHTGRMSWLTLRSLIEGLPPESLTMTAIRNAAPEDEVDEAAVSAEPERARWSRLEMLTASLIDAVQRGNYILLKANSDSKANIDPPEPVARPGSRPRAGRPEAPHPEALALLDQMIAASR